MQVTKLTRAFLFNGLRLVDPGPDLSPAAVKDFYSGMYPELVTAEVTSAKEVGDTLEYTFRKTTGTKGGKAAVKEGNRPFVERLQAADLALPCRSANKSDPTQRAVNLHRALATTGQPLQMPSPAIPLLL